MPKQAPDARWVHDHKPYDPPCNERTVMLPVPGRPPHTTTVLRGACLNDDGTPRNLPKRIPGAFVDHDRPKSIDPAVARTHRHAARPGPQTAPEYTITWAAALSILIMLGGVVALFLIFVLAVGRWLL